MKYKYEKWRDVPNYEGIYQVSNYGRMRNIKVSTKHLIKPSMNPNGYLIYTLIKDYKPTKIYVHRIVAQVFVSNKYSFIEVNHKDQNKANNYYKNLEWCTRKYQMNYADVRERISRSLKEYYQKKKMCIN